MCITPPCHHCIPRSIQTPPRPGSSKRHLFPDVPDSKHSPLPTALDQLYKASGRLLSWPRSSQLCQAHISPVPELPGQVRCHAKPCLRSFTSTHIPVHKSHFSLQVIAAFSLSTFIPTPTSLSATPVTPYVPEGLSETLIFIFFCIRKEVVNARNSCIKFCIGRALF